MKKEAIVSCTEEKEKKIIGYLYVMCVCTT